jgi:hypothetical protein
LAQKKSTTVFNLQKCLFSQSKQKIFENSFQNGVFGNFRVDLILFAIYIDQMPQNLNVLGQDCLKNSRQIIK